ncbi:MAG: ATPase domain-containing protein [Promethearchaeota archaeon]
MPDDFTRIPTGIEGLDELIEGGFPQNFVVLVAGSSGTGKTTLTMQYLIEGIKQGERGMYIGLGESSDVIKKSMARYDIDLDKLGETDDLVFADIPALEISDISALINSMSDRTKRVVIDPISALVFKYERELDLRQKIRELVELLREKGVTTIITTEVLEGSEGISRFGIEDFLADGIIVLYYFREGAKRFRGLEIRKMRGTAHSEMIHLYRIESGRGLRVFPREKVFHG